MHPTLIEDILVQRSRRFVNSGHDLVPALELAKRELLREAAPSMGPGDLFCFRALLTGAAQRLKDLVEELSPLASALARPTQS